VPSTFWLKRSATGGPCVAIHQLLLRVGQIAREVLDAALLEPDAATRHLDVVEHGSRWKLIKQALRGLVGIRREGRDIDEPGSSALLTRG
jgi:hypothetical protein